MTSGMTETGLKPTPAWEAWVRDDADATLLLEEVIETLGGIADERRGQDDEYAKPDADKLCEMADLAELVREHLERRENY